MSEVRSNLLRFGVGIIIVCLTFYYFSSKDGQGGFREVLNYRTQWGPFQRILHADIRRQIESNQTIDGTVPAEYSASATAVSVLIRRTEGDGTLMIEISRAGTVVNIAGNNDYNPITATAE